jgi:hypothetical protein
MNMLQNILQKQENQLVPTNVEQPLHQWSLDRELLTQRHYSMYYGLLFGI